MITPGILDMSHGPLSCDGTLSVTDSPFSNCTHFTFFEALYLDAIFSAASNKRF